MLGSVENNIFYTCSLIEGISRKTKQSKRFIVNTLGKDVIRKIYTLADIYSGEKIENTIRDFIEEFSIADGDSDRMKLYMYRVPSVWEIGSIIRRLVTPLVDERQQDVVEIMVEVLSSWFMNELDNYNSDLFYASSSYILECYRAGKILEN